MRALLHVSIFLAWTIGGASLAQEPARVEETKPAAPMAPKAAPLEINDLVFPEFTEAPLKIQALVHDAAVLLEKDPPYRYGVADPDEGFDCSGFVFYLLKENGAPNVPRQANTLHEFVVDKEAFHSYKSDPKLEDLEFGDLLFWTGTYKIDRNITHVMVYLGLDKKTGKRWMIGASNGARGVGIFLFRPEGSNGAGRHFVGYGKTSAFFPNLKKRFASKIGLRAS